MIRQPRKALVWWWHCHLFRPIHSKRVDKDSILCSLYSSSSRALYYYSLTDLRKGFLHKNTKKRISPGCISLYINLGISAFSKVLAFALSDKFVFESVPERTRRHSNFHYQGMASKFLKNIRHMFFMFPMFGQHFVMSYFCLVFFRVQLVSAQINSLNFSFGTGVKYIRGRE